MPTVRRAPTMPRRVGCVDGSCTLGTHPRMADDVIAPGTRSQPVLGRTLSTSRTLFAGGIGAALRCGALLTAVLAATVACATPIGVTREDPKILYRTLTKSVLSADEPSEFTEQLLRRRGLEKAFQQDPEA